MLNAPPAFQVMLKPSGAQCNLGCDYCYFLKKAEIYPGSDFHMSDEVLESFTRQYIQAQRVPQVTFAWQGGEPTLMGLGFFKQALAYQKRYAPAGMRIENSLQTNGTLLDDAWCAFFKEHNFLVGISVDGPQALHDTFRKDKAGKSSFARVMHALELLKKYEVDYNILACVHAANAAYPLEVYRFFRDEIGAEYIQFIPIVERANRTGEQKGNQVTKRSVTGSQYGNFLIHVFEEWVGHDVGAVFVQIFDVSLGKWLGASGGLCVFEETCGLGLALEHNGDLYSCDHFVEPKYKLGNILRNDLLQLVGSHKQLSFGLAKRTSLPAVCRMCEVLNICTGGCPKDRIRHAPGGEYGLNYLCEGYRAFFTHIEASMRTMSRLVQQGHPARDILKSP